MTTRAHNPTLGNVDADSAVHRMDARAKLLVCLLAMGVSLGRGPSVASLLSWPLLAAGVTASGMGAGRLLRGLKPFAGFLFFALLLHAAATPGRPLLALSGVGALVTAEGVRLGLASAAQLATAAAFALLLAHTTSPEELVAGLEGLFPSWGRDRGEPGLFALSLLVAFACLPALGRSVARMERRARGRARPGEGYAVKLRRRAELARPLLRRALKRSERIAERAAAERRAAPPRSRPFGRLEWAALGVAALAFAASFAAPLAGGAP